MDEIWQNPTVRLMVTAAIGGALGAARADYQAFKKQDTPQKFLEYRWDVAAYRWAHGAVTGALGVLLGDQLMQVVL